VRIVFAQKWPYYPNIGGGSKSQRLMIEQLVRLGHDCHVITPGCGPGYEAPAGLTLQLVSGLDGLVPAIREQAAAADLVVLPNDDHDWAMLAAAVDTAPGRVVCLVHTVQQLPFGARAFRADERATDLLGRCAGIACVSRAAQEYLATEAGLASEVVYPYVYEELLDAPASDGDTVMLVNPCAYKGIDVLLGLAARLPRVPFTGVRGWATTGDDLARLKEHDNIEIAEPDDIRKLLARARVLLMPSLWDETFGYTCVEAMLHGVPVLASRLGGLVEAKLGVPYSLPVKRIERYRDDGVAWRPGCDVPAQDLGPWCDALHALWSDEAHHASIAGRSRIAARRFVDGLAVHDLSDYLEGVAR
jgi:glycosyltransferase involved in cell wall biosynthesis